MANLFWKKGHKVFNLLSQPFKSEDEFERIIFDNNQLFEDLTFLKRQVQVNSSSERPDIIAIDSDGNVCIIEMKNKSVDEKIISQVLGYAIWAEANPDSLKNLWYELDDKPDDIEMDWDNYEVRIIVIAPEINVKTLRFLSSIHYKVDLIEIKRWVFEKNSFLLVNYLEQKEIAKSKTVKGVSIYNKEYYDKFRNKQSVVDFFKFINDVERLVKSKGWPLEKKFNKYYCGFKYGFINVFTIHWIGTKSFGLRVRMKESELKKLRPAGVEMTYGRKSGTFKITSDKINASRFSKLIAQVVKLKVAK